MRYKENFAQVEYDDFYLKIYNKGFQFGMDENILRIEIKTKRMREFSGIRTLADLTTKNLDKAILRLLKRWDDVLLYDCTINENNLSKLFITAEGKRRELFRRMNIAPNGTAIIVS